MTPQQLDRKLVETLDVFREEIVFMTETYDREYLDKEDIEHIGRQVFYTLHEFKDQLIKYLKEHDR